MFDHSCCLLANFAKVFIMVCRENKILWMCDFSSGKELERIFTNETNYHYVVMINISVFSILMLFFRCLDWIPWIAVSWTLWCFIRIFWWCHWVRYHLVSPALAIFLWPPRVLDCCKRWWQDRLPFGILQVKTKKINLIHSVALSLPIRLSLPICLIPTWPPFLLIFVCFYSN